MSSIRALLQHPQFRLGVKEQIGVCLGIGAWGVVTGVAMVESGVSVPLALVMTLIVFAGGAAVAAFALPFRLHIVVAIAAALCMG